MFKVVDTMDGALGSHREASAHPRFSGCECESDELLGQGSSAGGKHCTLEGETWRQPRER